MQLLGMWKGIVLAQAYLDSLCFADTVFLQIEGLWQPWVKQVYGAIFPGAFAHFMSLCHILIILRYFKLFHYYMCYGDRWSVIFAVTTITTTNSDDG